MSLESFSPYSMEFTILTDFSKRDLQGLHDVQQKHSGRGSYYEKIVPDVDHIEPVYSTMEREYCSNHPSLSQYAVSSNCSLSWVTMIVNAGERVLAQMGINERLSVDFVLQCYNRSDICEGMTMNEIATRLRQIGLVREEDAKHAMDEGESVCSIPLSQHYRFDVQKPEGYNRGGLMNLVSAGNPVLVAISMDLLQLRFVKDMREEEEVLRRSVYQPSIYGLVTGYVKTTEEVDGYWVFEGTPSPCESVNVKLPMRANETNTDFAGIAGYAFAIALKGGIPTTVAPTTVTPTTETPTTAPTEEPTLPTAEPTSIPTQSPSKGNECWSAGIPLNATEIIIPDNSCNGEEDTLDLSQFTQVKTLTVGNNCFGKLGAVELFKVNSLESVTIGMNSFNGGNYDMTSTLRVHDCYRLRELRIGRNSFTSYHECYIEGYALEVLEIGDVNEESNNFLHGSLRLTGLVMELLVTARSVKS